MVGSSLAHIMVARRQREYWKGLGQDIAQGQPPVSSKAPLSTFHHLLIVPLCFDSIVETIH
jgi:hypothetical protein